MRLTRVAPWTSRSYALRRDVGNVQLKSGVVAAFGLVRAMGAAEVLYNGYGLTFPGSFLLLEPDALEFVLTGALTAGESLLIFAFAALGLEGALRAGLVKPFPSTGK